MEGLIHKGKRTLSPGPLLASLLPRPTLTPTGIDEIPGDPTYASSLPEPPAPTPLAGLTPSDTQVDADAVYGPTGASTPYLTGTPSAAQSGGGFLDRLFSSEGLAKLGLAFSSFGGPYGRPSPQLQNLAIQNYQQQQQSRGFAGAMDALLQAQTAANGDPVILQRALTGLAQDERFKNNPAALKMLQTYMEKVNERVLTNAKQMEQSVAWNSAIKHFKSGRPIEELDPSIYQKLSPEQQARVEKLYEPNTVTTPGGGTADIGHGQYQSPKTLVQGTPQGYEHGGVRYQYDDKGNAIPQPIPGTAAPGTVFTQPNIQNGQVTGIDVTGQAPSATEFSADVRAGLPILGKDTGIVVTENQLRVMLNSSDPAQRTMAMQIMNRAQSLGQSFNKTPGATQLSDTDIKDLGDAGFKIGDRTSVNQLTPQEFAALEAKRKMRVIAEPVARAAGEESARENVKRGITGQDVASKSQGMFFDPKTYKILNNVTEGEARDPKNFTPGPDGLPKYAVVKDPQEAKLIEYLKGGLDVLPTIRKLTDKLLTSKEIRPGANLGNAIKLAIQKGLATNADLKAFESLQTFLASEQARNETGSTRVPVTIWEKVFKNQIPLSTDTVETAGASLDAIDYMVRTRMHNILGLPEPRAPWEAGSGKPYKTSVGTVR